MGDLVREPEWNQLRIEAESLSFGVCNAGEVLKADKRDSLPVDDELSGVGGTHANH